MFSIIHNSSDDNETSVVLRAGGAQVDEGAGFLSQAVVKMF